MSHSRTVRDEFTRQAESFAASPALRAAPITDRIVAALAEAPVERVVDLACGPGVMIPSLARVAGRVVGLDLTRGALGVARRGAGATAGFVQGFVERSPFATGSFDAAVLRLALHHMTDAGAVLGEARRLLRPGGRLVVLDVVGSEDPGVAALHEAIERLRDPSHVTFPRSGPLRRAITEAGFGEPREERFDLARSFEEWARIIAEPVRMDALETVMRHLARTGHDLGIRLREEEGQLRFDYPFALWLAR